MAPYASPNVGSQSLNDQRITAKMVSVAPTSPPDIAASTNPPVPENVGFSHRSRANFGINQHTQGRFQ